MKNELAIAFAGIMAGFSFAILLVTIFFVPIPPENFVDYAYCVIQSGS